VEPNAIAASWKKGEKWPAAKTGGGIGLFIENQVIDIMGQIVNPPKSRLAT
jgi:hypothetical protein